MARVAGSRRTLFDASLLFCRVTLGLYFSFAGYWKVRGEFANGFGSFYRGPFTGMKPGWLPDLLAAPYGYALPWIEMLLGLTLTIGLLGTLSAALVALVLLSIMIAQFGVGGLVAFQGETYKQPGPYHATVIFLSLAVLQTIAGPGRFSVDALLPRSRKRGADA